MLTIMKKIYIKRCQILKNFEILKNFFFLLIQHIVWPPPMLLDIIECRQMSNRVEMGTKIVIANYFVVFFSFFSLICRVAM